MEEIVVSARKRAERAQDVPDSLVALTPDQIEVNNITQAGDLGKIYPDIGFKQDLSVTSTFISIRGITSTRNTDPAVALVIDGVQTSNASDFRQDLFDVQQIEVLKGPQGSLYGRDAIAGAINIVTVSPTNTYQAYAEGGFGNANAATFNGSVSGPIIPDKLYFRASGRYYDDDGTIPNPAVGGHPVDFQNDKSGRLRILATPTDELTIDLKYNHDEFKGGSYYYVVTRPNGAPFPFSDPASNSNSFSGFPESVPISVDYSTIDDESLRVAYDLKFATLASVTALSNTRERYGVPGEGIGSNLPGDLDFTPAPIEANSQTYSIFSWSEELRLTSEGTGPFRWMGGFYYLSISRDDTLPVYLNFGGGLFAPPNPFDPKGTHRNINAYAGFAQFDYDILDQLTATFGIRYDVEDRDQLDKDNPDPRTNFQSATFQLPEPKFSLSWKIDPDDMSYITVSRGFRSGGFNTPRSIFAEIYEPEKLWNYEIGYKGRALDGRLEGNAALFYEDITNVQDFVFDAVNAAQTIYNIPKASVKGIELQLSYEPIDDLVLTGSGGFMDSSIDKFEYGPLFPTPLNNAAIVGKHLPGFSHWGIQFAVDYKHPLTNDYMGTIHVDYSLRGKGYWDITNIDEEKDIDLLGFDVGVEWKNYRLSVWGTNMLDTKYWSNWFNQQTTGLPDVGYPAEPRRFGVKLSAKF